MVRYAEIDLSLAYGQGFYLFLVQHLHQLRQRYVDIKIAYWKAVASGDTQQIEATRERTYALAQELKLPKALSKEEVKEV